MLLDALTCLLGSFDSATRGLLTRLSVALDLTDYCRCDCRECIRIGWHHCEKRPCVASRKWVAAAARVFPTVRAWEDRC